MNGLTGPTEINNYKQWVVKTDLTVVISIVGRRSDYRKIKLLEHG